jgi:hypothetical protein
MGYAFIGECVHRLARDPEGLPSDQSLLLSSPLLPCKLPGGRLIRLRPYVLACSALCRRRRAAIVSPGTAEASFGPEIEYAGRLACWLVDL